MLPCQLFYLSFFFSFLDTGTDFLWTNTCFHRVLSRKGPWSQERGGAEHKGVMKSRLSVVPYGLSSRLRGGKTQWETLGHIGLELALAEKKPARLLPLRRPFIQQQQDTL